MASNDMNNSYNVGTNNERNDVFQRYDSTSETRKERDETTPVREEQNHRHVGSLTPDDMDDKCVVEKVKILRKQQKIIMNHFSRQKSSNDGVEAYAFGCFQELQ